MTASAVTIILLAGGEARRLPGKLMLLVDGEPLVVNTFRRLTRDGRRPCVLSVRARLDPAVQAAVRVPVIPDEYPNCGPLGGLLSAAAAVQTPLFFAAAADLPYVGAGFIDRLEQRYRELQAASGAAPVAVLPRNADGRTEPLAALYDTAAFRTGAAAAIGRGEKKVTAALNGDVAYLELSAADARELVNINTAADWRRLESMQRA